MYDGNMARISKITDRFNVDELESYLNNELSSTLNPLLYIELSNHLDSELDAAMVTELNTSKTAVDLSFIYFEF